MQRASVNLRRFACVVMALSFGWELPGCFGEKVVIHRIPAASTPSRPVVAATPQRRVAPTYRAPTYRRPTPTYSWAQRLLVGVWKHSSSNRRMFIRMRGGVPKVTAIIDGDGEVFRVLRSHWNGRTLSFSFYVPSSRVTVTHVMRSLRGNRMVTRWRNYRGSGSHIYYRIR